MAIVFAGVVPHTPLLIPGVAKEHQQTNSALRHEVELLAAEVHARQPDTVIVLSPHGTIVEDVPVVFVADRYQGTLREFGDIQSRIDAPGDPVTAHHLKESAEDHDVPLSLQTVSELDYGSLVPILSLATGLAGRKILAIGVGGVAGSRLVEVGTVLHDVLQTSSQRFALLASADWSRRPKKQRLDASADRPTKEEKIAAEALGQVSPTPLLESSFSLQTCGWAPTLVLLSALTGMKASGEIHHFSASFGVGEFVATINLGSA